MEKVLVGLGILAAILVASVVGGLLINTLIEDERGPSVAVIPVHGFITRDAEVRSFDADTGVSLIEESDADDNVVAIVLDIDSSGGTVVATEMVMRAINKTNKPIVAWIGGTGASGGYFIASTTDYIVSDPLSITGSVGVASQVPNAEELMRKVGLKLYTFTSGDLKDMGSYDKSMTPAEMEIMQGIVDNIYDELSAGVIKRRGLDENATELISDGRIMLGKNAYKIGLVDELGGLDLAIERAANFANTTNYEVIHVKRDLSFSEILSNMMSLSAKNIGLGLAEGLTFRAESKVI